MKKISTIVLVIILIMLTLLTVSCNHNDLEVVLKIDKNYVVENGGTLLDYMEYLEERGKLNYEEENGMIISINEKANSLNSYWMLYTDDPNNSNKAWGTYEYKDKLYYSATLGATDLHINKEYTYIWVYQTF